MSGERTEQATPKKLRESRRRGEVWRSRLLGAALTSIAAGAVLGAMGEAILAAHVASFRLALDAAAGRVTAAPGAVLEAAVATAADAVAPLLVALVVVGALAGLVQVGPLFAPEAIAWRPSRIDPVRGARRLVDPRRAVEALQALLIALVVAYVSWATLREGLHGVLSLSSRDALAALGAAGALVRTLLLRVGAAVLVIAVLDMLYQRWQWHRDQRMTKREVEREHREAEGDPHVRRERDRVRHELAERSELEHAAHAEVLVIGGGCAIALRFDRDRQDAVPEVIARGRDELAVRMTRAASRAGVPVAEDAELARALLELHPGDSIPERQYAPVAAVLRAAWTERDRST